MKRIHGDIRLSATDISSHLACTRVTVLDLELANGTREKPQPHAPDLAVIQERGFEHERAYVASLQSAGLTVIDLTNEHEGPAAAKTLDAMASGVDVIVQGALSHEAWFGRPDVLRKTSVAPQTIYEPYDCKLARQTKATTILQLLHYANLLHKVTGVSPDLVHVVSPAPAGMFRLEPYRTLDYAAFYRMTRARLEQAIRYGRDIYPEPCDHCHICRWWKECDTRRRLDDHLSLTAGIRRLQRKQLEEWDVHTMTALAYLETPVRQRPRYGSKEGYADIQRQASVQVQGKREHQPVWKMAPVHPEKELGLRRLPLPAPGDVFFDLESDPFVGENGLEYLFGFGTINSNGHFIYHRRWATNTAEERAAFEWFVDEMMRHWETFPSMHIYHYGHKESSTLKRLMGAHASREEQVDRMLRGGLLIDLLSMTKQSLWASVEQYSLKALEPFHNFKRTVPLPEAQTAMREFEHQLERQNTVSLDTARCTVIEGYNKDDCESTSALRNWLERLRAELEQQGTAIPRPAPRTPEPTDKVHDRQQRVDAMVARLKNGLPEQEQERDEDQSARWLLADLLDWHWREKRVSLWEKFDLARKSSEELMDERDAIGSLTFVQSLGKLKPRQRSNTYEYSFPPQETSLEEGDAVLTAGTTLGTVSSIDLAQGLLRIRQSEKMDAARPDSVYHWKEITTKEQADSLIRIAEAVLSDDPQAQSPFSSAIALLKRHAPRQLLAIPTGGETTEQAALRLTLALDGEVLAIQGPPGAGKTHTGSEMILKAIAAGLRVGVTANSHKVIRTLFKGVQEAAQRSGRDPVRCLHKLSDDTEREPNDWVEETTSNAAALQYVTDKSHELFAGTAWLWARPEFAASVDLLFVDEAGQMSLANTLAIAPAARNLVLLGDPQQLEQPVKGNHPDGAAVSALDHILHGEKTIPPTQGLFLAETWRLHPDICRFTSELFYENLLQPRAGLDRQKIAGHPWLGEAGVRFVGVEHEGCQNSSNEEAERVRDLVESFLAPNVHWVNRHGQPSRLTLQDILIVAPYNAHVSLLARTLPPGMRIGTVDKFQGQQAPVVIYSLATSQAEDAPRGMEFLYSLNRLNVATSRAQAMIIVVASPKLLDVECKTPRQLRLANALCRYVEMSAFEAAGTAVA